jgi:multimeric flavodoxin WrbA
VNVLALSASPRRDGNSRLLADAFLDGAADAGHHVELAHLDDHVGGFLRDCKRCRGPDGRCSIEDGFEALLYDRYLPAGAVALATPLYWYGVSGQLKTFLDRLFCYIAASYPDSQRVIDGLMSKRLALLISSEETYLGASLGVLHQIQEFARYTHCELIGVVIGIGNHRGEVVDDPGDPIGRARALGRDLGGASATDYRIDTERPTAVWGHLPRPDHTPSSQRRTS